MGWGEGSGYSAVNVLTIADKKIRWFVGLRSNINVLKKLRESSNTEKSARLVSHQSQLLGEREVYLNYE
jgi:hypothetical protein